MSDVYDELEEIKNRYEIEKHNESREKYQVDPSCLKCYKDDELDIRFAKFEEWLDEIESVTIKNKGYGTMRYFKEILHLEENIVEEENRKKVKKFQKNKIIEKIVEKKGFVEEYSDVGELESSDDTGELSSNEGDEHIERTYRNYWLENDGEILNWKFIKLFQENKNELEGVIKEILDKYLEEQIETEGNNEEEEDTNNSEKIGEILDPEEYEIWEGNSEDFDENKVENNDENIINTEGFGLSQNSDSNNLLNIKNSDIENSDTESELSDYNLQDLFQKNILLNMATEIQMRRMLENALGLTANNALDNALEAGQTIVNRIATAGNGGIVGIPTFSGKEDED
ncbi:hypothetical protein RhiirC2_797951, partial [Rhizophagus irregularis]